VIFLVLLEFPKKVFYKKNLKKYENITTTIVEVIFFTRVDLMWNNFSCNQSSFTICESWKNSKKLIILLFHIKSTRLKKIASRIVVVICSSF
jgi:hypothetical protein